MTLFLLFQIWTGPKCEDPRSQKRRGWRGRHRGLYGHQVRQQSTRHGAQNGGQAPKDQLLRPQLL